MKPATMHRCAPVTLSEDCAQFRYSIVLDSLGMPVLNEDTFALMCLVEQNATLYDDCVRITLQTLEHCPPRGDVRKGIGHVAARARRELATTLQRLIRYADDAEIQDHLDEASIDWRDVARELIADVLCHADT